METILGDIDNSGGINGTESPAATLPYLLWGPGRIRSSVPPQAIRPAPRMM